MGTSHESHFPSSSLPSCVQDLSRTLGILPLPKTSIEHQQSLSVLSCLESWGNLTGQSSNGKIFVDIGSLGPGAVIERKMLELDHRRDLQSVLDLTPAFCCFPTATCLFAKRLSSRSGQSAAMCSGFWQTRQSQFGHQNLFHPNSPHCVHVFCWTLSMGQRLSCQSSSSIFLIPCAFARWILFCTRSCFFACSFTCSWSFA